MVIGFFTLPISERFTTATMTEVIALLACLSPCLEATAQRRLACLIEAVLAMTGRVTMLGISRWTEGGGSYRTVQRFFNTPLDWLRRAHSHFPGWCEREELERRHRSPNRQYLLLNLQVQ